MANGDSSPVLVLGESLPERLLEEAAERVCLRFDELFPGDDPGRRPALKRRLASLVVAIEHLSAGGESTHTGLRGTGDGRDEALLFELERELLRRIPLGEVDAVLRALQGCSALRASLAPERTPPSLPRRDPSQDGGRDAEEVADELRTRMLGPNAFELLVEVAHDFRSPLTSILFLSEALREGHSGPVTEIQRSQLGLVYSAAFGLASIASDVVDLARRGKNLVEDEPEPYSFSEVLGSVERMVRPIAEEKGLDLLVRSPERGQAEGHPHALRRVLLNLTSNALKFTDRGSVEFGVRRLPQSRIEYYVIDTGRGISEERQRDLFQPFKRRLGRGQEGEFFSGSGIGLTMARRLVEAMGGELRFETTLGQGTRFFFTLQDPPRR